MPFVTPPSTLQALGDMEEAATNHQQALRYAIRMSSLAGFVAHTAPPPHSAQPAPSLRDRPPVAVARGVCGSCLCGWTRR